MKIIIPGLVVFALWSTLCVRWYVCGVKELCDRSSASNNELVPELADSQVDSTPVVESLPGAPLSFEWSNWEPQLGNEFPQYRDSIQQIFSAEPGAEVEITGLFDPQELNNSNFDNLGLARAQAVKDLLLASGIKRSITVSSQIEDLSSGIGEKITMGVVYKLLPGMPTNTFVIVQKGAKLTIHYPSNKHAVQSDKKVMSAINRLAQQAIKQNRSIVVVGHTDNQGESRGNKILGLVRATEIKEILMESGMPESKVLAESEGEDVPIAGNHNPQGRHLNRRVELVII